MVGIFGQDILGVGFQGLNSALRIGMVRSPLP